MKTLLAVVKEALGASGDEYGRERAARCER